jgi:hypothetical protein
MNIATLRRKHEYYKYDAPPWAPNIWRTYGSFDWFVKDNRDALVASGALIRIGRDYFVDCARFPEAACGILNVSLPKPQVGDAA